MLILGAVTCCIFIIYVIVVIAKKNPHVNEYFFYSAIVIFLIAIILVSIEIDTQNQFAEINKWPRLEAQIIAKEISGNRAVLPEVTYQYVVGGYIYIGKSNLGIPAFGGRNKRTLTAQVALKDLPLGSSLIIAYNPANPKISTTQLHPPWNHYGKIGFGAFLYAFALMVLLFKIPLKRNKLK